MASPTDFNYLDLFRTPTSNFQAATKSINEDRKMSSGSQETPADPKKVTASERSQKSKKTTKKTNRGRKRQTEEEYTDKDRAAAVNMPGIWDIKLSLRYRRKLDQNLPVSTDLIHTEDFLSAMLLVEARYQLRIKKQPEAALATINKALELNPKYKKALVARSQCHLKLGDAMAALKDAEKCLEGREGDLVGLYEYAEALYNLGHFEKALIAYHRGYRMKQVESFRVGIQKSQEAIQLAIGESSATQIEDLDRILPLIEQLEPLGLGHDPGPSVQPVESEKAGTLKTGSKLGARWVSKEVLGKMSLDKDFLTKILHVTEIHKDEGASPKLRSNANEGLNYLNIRQDFWRQQNPMYSRKPGLNLNNKIFNEYAKQEMARQEVARLRRAKIDGAQGTTFKNAGLSTKTKEDQKNCSKSKTKFRKGVRTTTIISHAISRK